MSEKVQIRVYGDDSLPALVYLPGLHGDWTLVTGFRLAIADRVRFVEVTYPRSIDWSIAEYTSGINAALIENGIQRGWLIGESFGSQFAWQLIANYATHPDAGQFKVDGLVLAGGFVKHPWKQGPGLLRWIGEHTPMKLYRFELAIYSLYSRFRHRHSPELLASLHEFVERRTDLDRQAMRHRLSQLDIFDPRPLARDTTLPVQYLAGLIDPLVPWPLVRWWLRKHCPGYRGGKTFWFADHNVLATSPRCSADLVVNWMSHTTSSN